MHGRRLARASGGSGAEACRAVAVSCNDRTSGNHNRPVVARMAAVISLCLRGSRSRRRRRVSFAVVALRRKAGLNLCHRNADHAARQALRVGGGFLPCGGAPRLAHRPPSRLCHGHRTAACLYPGRARRGAWKGRHLQRPDQDDLGTEIRGMARCPASGIYAAGRDREHAAGRRARLSGSAGGVHLRGKPASFRGAASRSSGKKRLPQWHRISGKTSRLADCRNRSIASTPT